jgi:hypothetical protein
VPVRWGFSLYFCAYLPRGMVAADLPGALGSADRQAFLWSLPATVELTHNHGSELQDGPAYHAGNNYDGVNEGFGHLGITVWARGGWAKGSPSLKVCRARAPLPKTLLVVGLHRCRTCTPRVAASRNSESPFRSRPTAAA